MADEYVIKCTLDVNGESVTDFKGIREGEVELRKQINLMNKTGFAVTTPRYTVGVDYAVPSAAEFDWESVENGTLVIEYEGGRRRRYAGVCTLSIGEATLDNENELVRAVQLGASGRTDE